MLPLERLKHISRVLIFPGSSHRIPHVSLWSTTSEIRFYELTEWLLLVLLPCIARIHFYVGLEFPRLFTENHANISDCGIKQHNSCKVSQLMSCGDIRHYLSYKQNKQWIIVAWHPRLSKPLAPVAVSKNSEALTQNGDIQFVHS